MDSAGFEFGTIVHDRDDNDPSDAIVVNTPPVPVSEWDAYHDVSVAEDNPDYPSDDPVVCIVYVDDLPKKYEDYWGATHIPLADLRARGTKFYSFPESRLEAIDKRDPTIVGIDRIRPSPYHDRTFSVDRDGSLIDRIRENGRPVPIPLARKVNGHYEMIDGHKRLWGSYVVGLETIPISIRNVDDDEARLMYAKHHSREDLVDGGES